MLETIKQTVRSFASHGGRVLGAATAFYALLSVAPLMLMAVVIMGAVTDEASARRQVVSDLSLWIGGSNAEVIGELLDRLDDSGHGPFAGVVGIGVLIWAASRLFSQLRYSLNHLWGVREVGGGGISRSAMLQARRRLSALAMVFVVVIVVVLTVLGKTALSAAARHFGPAVDRSWHALEFGVSFVVLTLLCLAVFKVLPAVRIAWRDACIGAVVTALLFSLGASGIGWYLGFTGTSSTYGAAGSLVALLLWVYYSAQAFFLGAAFTRVHAERHGRGLTLVRGAVRVVEEGDLPPPEQAGQGAGA